MSRLASFLAVLLAAPCSFAATFTVTNTNTGGAGSLYRAITDANQTKTADVIEFSIPSLETVTINGPLPDIDAPLTINGYSQSGASPNDKPFVADADIRVQLDASQVPLGGALLQVDDGPTTIRGIAIKGLASQRIGISIGINANDVVVQGCFIGMLADGSTDASSGTGIRIDGADALIGGSLPAYANLISGNDGAGIDIRGTGARVLGNLIGTDNAGADPVANGTGILIGGANADNILIGANDQASANLIAGNANSGIAVLATAGGNVSIRGNRFRDNGDLAIDLGNDGVTPNDETDADVGANHLQNYPVLTFARLNGTTLVVEGYFQSSPASYRFEFYLVNEPDPTGFGEGLRLLAAMTPTTSGGTFHFRFAFPVTDVPTEEFFVSATAENLSTLETSEFSESIGVVFGGDELVVTNADDSGPGSLRAAIEEANEDLTPDTIVFELPQPLTPIQPQSTLTIDETVIIDGYTQATARPNTLGFGSNAELKVEIDLSLAPDGTSPLQIDAAGVVLRGLAIHSSPGIGVLYSGGYGGRIEGCFIGTDLTGTAALQNGSHGIFTGAGAGGIVIGGELPAQRNVISGNDSHGMLLTGDDIRVSGNIVGADATALEPLGNGFNGISVEGENALIGGNFFGDPANNVIRFNGDNGIAVSQTTSRVRILGNSIDDNGDLGIDLAMPVAGVTPNDADDVDSGANDLQNFPVITNVIPSSITPVVEGTLDVPAAAEDAIYTINVFAGDSCDDSGHGEGRTFLSAHDALLSDDDEDFALTLAKGLDAGDVVTLTATDVATGNTSEFSACFIVGTDVPLCGDATGNDALNSGDALIVLKTAVGTENCALCICDVNGSGSVSSTDALLVLRKAVGQNVGLDCPDCF